MAKKAKGKGRKAGSAKLKGRKAAAQHRSVRATLSGFVAPLAVSAALILCIALFGTSAYRAATGSDFFRLKDVAIFGNERTSEDDIRRIVISEVEKAGVWNADLSEIRTKVEKFPFVRTASVARALPAGIRVHVRERVPAALVQLKAGPFLVDGEGTILAAARPGEFPVVLRGWDEGKTERAVTENRARLAAYIKMLDEWRQFDLVSRVRYVDLSDMRGPVAVIEDSGREIGITLAKDGFGKKLKTAIEAVSGKGSKVRSVDAAGIVPIIQYLEL